MKKTIPITLMRRLFSVASLLIVLLFFVFLGYLYIAFIGPLTGDVLAPSRPDLLTKLETKKFDAAVARFQLRQNQPDVRADLPNPFKAVKKEQ